MADERLGWALSPGSTGVHRSEGNFDVRYGIDEHGRRRVANRGAPRHRIWLFGDSFSFGHGVADDDTFASVLAQRYLRPGIHVVNLAVMGYGLPQMLQRLEDVEDEIAAGDVVLFAPTTNDLLRTLPWFTYPSKHLFQHAKGRVRAFPDFRDGELVTAALDTPCNRLRALLYHARYTGGGFEWIDHHIHGVDPLREAAAMLDSARATAERRGARFALVFLPHPVECAAGAYRLEVERLGPIDLLADFPRAPAEVAALHFPSDSHLNERGHEIAARALAKELSREGILDDEFLLPAAGS